MNPDASELLDRQRQHVHTDFHPVYDALRRLREHGYDPGFVMDVGASSGCWSWVCQLVYPASRYILVEPFADTYRKRPYYLIDQFPQFELVEAAVSDVDGEVLINLADDGVSTSMFNVGDRLVGRVAITAKCLQTISVEKNITGRGLLKLDVQFAEHLAIAGAGSFLEQVDVVIAEVSLYRVSPETRTYGDFIALMQEHDFAYFDDAGEYRRGGLMYTKDVVFVRSELARRLADM